MSREKIITIQTLSRNHDFAFFFIIIFLLALGVARVPFLGGAKSCRCSNKRHQGERKEGEEEKELYERKNILSFVISTLVLCVICILESRLGRPGVFQWIPSPLSTSSLRVQQSKSTGHPLSLSLSFCCCTQDVTQ